MVKKSISLLMTLVLLCSLAACGKADEPSKEQSGLTQNTLYAYNVFMDAVPESVEFTLKGKIPSNKKTTGAFSGYIQVRESDGTKHTYQNLEYVWQDDILLLYSGNPTAEKSKGVLCWVDPENPESTFIADRNWCEPNKMTELIAYVSSELTLAEQRNIGIRINQIEGVYSATFKSAEQVLDDFAENHNNISSMETEALRARYSITIETENLEATIAQIEKIPGIEEVSASLWAPESIRLIGPKKQPEKMKAAFEKLPELPA